MEKPNGSAPELPLLLGCPVWNCDAWGDTVYPSRTAKKNWLSWYSAMFNTVEGNSSFYAIPTVEVARRWVTQAARGFRFCMKFPREISHERALIGAEQATGDFLDVLYELASGDVLGPSFLQLGPDFGPEQSPALERFLRSLPSDLPFALELRHSGWFDSAAWEQRVDELLGELHIDKVIFDSRPLYQSPPDDDIERVSQTRKPKTPLRRTVTGERPMLRLVGRNRIGLTHRFIDEWVPIVAGWMRDGLQPIVFTHAPNDAFAPAFAREFWSRLAAHLPQPQPQLPTLPERPKQLELLFE